MCVFHVLQKVWRWLYERQHRISKGDRIEIRKLFGNLVYAYRMVIEGYRMVFEDFLNYLRTQKYKNCVKHFEELCEISKGWGKCFRSEHLITT